MKKILIRIMTILVSSILLITVFGVGFMQQAKFGKLPSGERLERIQQSPNYRDGAFQNQSHTPDLTEGATYFGVMKEFMFADKKRNKPSVSLPSTYTDLKALQPTEDVLVWFGHSSYFMQIDGKRILVDPVFSGAASPVSFTTKAFAGTDRYTAADMPAIDYLFLSHDHWDHADHQTLLELKSKVKRVVCGLGVGEHLEHWGFDKNSIIEKDWYESSALDSGFTAHLVPARHFSGRGLKRNKSLWTSFVLQTPTMRIFIGGDSGYDKHFVEAGKKFGSFDLAILENGQYDKSWRYIHMLPDEVLQAAQDLNAKRLLPVHSSKFALGNHDWDTPLKTITSLPKDTSLTLLTPIIGERVNLKDSLQTFKHWWEGVE